MSKRKRAQDPRFTEIEEDEDVGAETYEDDEDEDVDPFFLSKKKTQTVEETADEKRVRMAEKYLEQMKKQKKAEEENQEEDIDGDILSHRLTTQLLKNRGKIAQRTVNFKEGIVTILCEKKGEGEQNGIQKKNQLKETVKSYKPGHQKSITSVAISSDDKYIYSVSHDSIVVRWEISTGKKQKFPNPIYKTKRPRIFCMALSSDNEYLATSGSENSIHIWKTSSLSLHHTFKSEHRGPVYGLAFQIGSHQLYSCSADRTVKVFSIDEKAYIDTLFGHQSEVIDIVSFQRERAISSGTDGSVHLWKISEQSQLIFRSQQTSIDSVKVLNENHFVTGSQDGVISLWSLNKKNAIGKLEQAHGLSDSGVPNWISSLATLRNTELIASGSCNSEIKIWKVNLSEGSFTHLATITEAFGWVNSLEFSSSGNYLIAGLGREHRLGRWQPVREARNRVLLISLP